VIVTAASVALSMYNIATVVPEASAAVVAGIATDSDTAEVATASAAGVSALTL